MSISPVVTRIPICDPTAAFAPFAGEAMAVLLDSALAGPRARFSYIATDPVRIIRCTSHPWMVTVDGAARATDPIAVVKAELGCFSANADTCPGSGPAPYSRGRGWILFLRTRRYAGAGTTSERQAVAGGHGHGNL
ncbi:MAG: hypothetical protein EXQ84_03375 [Rhodospirillaceae bacterium]|nr:hypothetical protein [Rhodospirillaceae bacterium]